MAYYFSWVCTFSSLPFPSFPSISELCWGAHPDHRRYSSEFPSESEETHHIVSSLGQSGHIFTCTSVNLGFQASPLIVNKEQGMFMFLSSLNLPNSDWFYWIHFQLPSSIHSTNWHYLFIHLHFLHLSSLIFLSFHSPLWFLSLHLFLNIRPLFVWVTMPAEAWKTPLGAVILTSL